MIMHNMRRNSPKKIKNRVSPRIFNPRIITDILQKQANWRGMECASCISTGTVRELYLPSHHSQRPILNTHRMWRWLYNTHFKIPKWLETLRVTCASCLRSYCRATTTVLHNIGIESYPAWSCVSDSLTITLIRFHSGSAEILIIHALHADINRECDPRLLLQRYMKRAYDLSGKNYIDKESLRL